MAVTKSFRSAFNGFNREDVVHYIEYINNQHNNQIEQLKNQLQIAQSSPAEDTSELQTKLDEALARCAELEAKLAEAAEPTDTADAQEAEAPLSGTAARELEAYRRAERIERIAQERAQQIYAQVNAVLADTALKAETAAEHVGSVADQAVAQLQDCLDSVSATKEAFREAVATLYAARPEDFVETEEE